MSRRETRDHVDCYEWVVWKSSSHRHLGWQMSMNVAFWPGVSSRHVRVFEERCPTRRQYSDTWNIKGNRRRLSRQQFQVCPIVTHDNGLWTFWRVRHFCFGPYWDGKGEYPHSLLLVWTSLLTAVSIRVSAFKFQLLPKRLLSHFALIMCNIVTDNLSAWYHDRSVSAAG
jgi:hypothetical protein